MLDASLLLLYNKLFLYFVFLQYFVLAMLHTKQVWAMYFLTIKLKCISLYKLSDIRGGANIDPRCMITTNFVEVHKGCYILALDIVVSYTNKDIKPKMDGPTKDGEVIPLCCHSLAGRTKILLVNSKTTVVNLV
jgi:hypothetical protein